MKQCTNCGNMLTDDATYCNVCNTALNERFDDFEARPKYNDTFLKVLCILTIIGAVFGIVSEISSFAQNQQLPIEGIMLVGYLSLTLSVVKLGSAIAMLKKKLAGLYFYTIAAILGITVQIYSAVITADYMDAMIQNTGSPIGGNALMTVGTSIVVVFYLAFLIMYWLPVNRRLLS